MWLNGNAGQGLSSIDAHRGTYDGGQKNLGTVWKHLPKYLLHRFLFLMALLMTIFSSALGPSRRPLTLPQNFVAKRELISTYFAQNSALFGVGRKVFLVSLMPLKRSQQLTNYLALSYFGRWLAFVRKIKIKILEELFSPSWEPIEENFILLQHLQFSGRDLQPSWRASP